MRKIISEPPTTNNNPKMPQKQNTTNKKTNTFSQNLQSRPAPKNTKPQNASHRSVQKRNLQTSTENDANFPEASTSWNVKKYVGKAPAGKRSFSRRRPAPGVGTRLTAPHCILCTTHPKYIKCDRFLLILHHIAYYSLSLGYVWYIQLIILRFLLLNIVIRSFEFDHFIIQIYASLMSINIILNIKKSLILYLYIFRITHSIFHLEQIQNTFCISMKQKKTERIHSIKLKRDQFYFAFTVNFKIE